MKAEAARLALDTARARRRGPAACVARRREPLRVRPLACGEEGRAQSLLGADPVRNVILSSMLAEYGLDGPQSRGRFYGCFRGARLAGVALLGHHALFCGGEDAARAFARAARRAHAAELSVMLAAPSEAAAFRETFGAGVSACGCRPATEPNLLLRLTNAAGVSDDFAAAGVRPAEPAETDEVARIHAHGSLALYGFDPGAADPEGYRRRVLARVRSGRVWIGRDASGVTFKTDLAAQSSGVLYLEGVLTRPDLVGTGVGTRAFASLCREMLRHYDTLCLLVAESNQRAFDFYRRIGFQVHARYTLIRYHQPDGRLRDAGCGRS